MQKCNETLAREGGVFRRVDNLGTRPLAYRMKAHGKWNDNGRFLRLRIQASPHNLKELEQRLTVDDEVIRLMTLKMALAPRGPPALSKKQLKRDTKKAERHAEVAATNDALSNSTFIQRFRTLDYYAAQALFKAGAVSADELDHLPRWNVSNAGATSDLAQAQESDKPEVVN